MSKLYFFRHAQASYGADNYDQLSPKGLEQSKLLGQYLVEKNIHFDKIFCGPLVRQKHTYEIVAKAYQDHSMEIPAAITIEGLREHGGTEAMKAALPQLSKDHPQINQWLKSINDNPALTKRNSLLAFQFFLREWALGKIVVPGHLEWKVFRQNVRQGLKAVLDQTPKGSTIGVFTSGGTISSITADALDLKNEERVAAMNYSIRNTSFASFLFSKGEFNLMSFNELPHLDGGMVTFV